MKKYTTLLSLAMLMATGLSAQQLGKPAETESEFDKAYAWRIRQENLDGVYIPKDLTEAFLELNRLTEKSSREKYRNAPEEEATHRLFFSLGRWITTNWSFYEGSRLSEFLRKLGLHHPDDMALFIMITWHRSLNQSPLEVKNLVDSLEAKRKEELKEYLERGTLLKEETRPKEKNERERE